MRWTFACVPAQRALSVNEVPQVAMTAVSVDASAAEGVSCQVFFLSDAQLYRSDVVMVLYVGIDVEVWSVSCQPFFEEVVVRGAF